MRFLGAGGQGVGSAGGGVGHRGEDGKGRKSPSANNTSKPLFSLSDDIVNEHGRNARNVIVLPRRLHLKKHISVAVTERDDDGPSVTAKCEL